MIYVIRPPSPSMRKCVHRSQDPLRFSDSLEGLTELLQQKLLHSLSQFMTVEGDTLKSESEKKKTLMAESRKDQSQAFGGPLPEELHRQHLFHSVTMYDSTHEVLPTKEACPRLDVWGFYWRPGR